MSSASQVLHDLVNVIVLILLEPGVPDLPEGSQLVRALNVLTVKIVDRSDHNAISSALIKLLHECIGSSVLSGKYCVLVMKCIWKVDTKVFNLVTTSITSGYPWSPLLVGQHGRVLVAG